MEAESDKLRNAYKTAVIIGIAMMGSVLVYVVVAELMRNLPTPWKGIMFSADHAEYHYVRYGLLALGILIPLVVVKISTAVNLSPEKLANPIPALITHSVIVYAACETAGIFGLVLFLLAGNIIDMYIFAGISLAFSLISFPRYRRWKEITESRPGGPTFE
jgi:hypothetical protein